MKFTYALIDVCTLLVPFLFSFHPKLQFYKQWPALLPAMLITGLAFLAWDVYFTHLKIWGFNNDYVLGINVINLPVEEVLFFLCIPYSCMFTYASLKVLIHKTFSLKAASIISPFLIIAAIFMAGYFSSRYYTCYTFLALAILLFFAQYVLKAAWLPRFYFTYLILLVPFLIVNGLLTGTGLANPVVWYNSAHIINIRILTIPFEDIFYGMALILLNTILYYAITAKLSQNKSTHAYAASST